MNAVYESVTRKEQLKISGGLSSDDLEFCKKESKQITDVLSPKQFAMLMMLGTEACSLIDLLGAEEAGEIIIGRLEMNRKPKDKSIDAMAGTILEIGAQIMCLVIPATVAVRFGYKVTDFDGNPIPDDKLCMTIVIIDGQTRYSAIRKIRKENPDKKVPGLYAYFPLNWVKLDKMLQAINLKVFTWSNSDFMTGVISNANVDEPAKAALKYIQNLETKGYNYTAACELVTLKKGIIRKGPLVKAMSEEKPQLDFSLSEFGIDIHRVAITKFIGKYENALKNKTVPELIIAKWEKSCKELSQKEATEYIKSFLGGLASDELVEMESPSEYLSLIHI